MVSNGLNCKHCGLYLRSINQKHNHYSCNKSKKSKISRGNEKEQTNPVLPKLIAACLKGELFYVVAFQEIEWHAIEDID